MPTSIAREPATEPPDYAIELIGVGKRYGTVTALTDVNLEIVPGEFVVLLGPSGCGKSTILKIIAGLEDATEGEIYINGLLANYVRPKDRDISMVFQNYALYPHMTVEANLGFPLKMRRVPRDEIARAVAEVAQLLDLGNYLARYPEHLSGGQRQRVALGRAIIRQPVAFLMDEPLSNLDALLRVQMRSELLKLHRRVGRATLYVTHDQIEAMTMADRIVVMKAGVVQQVGRPDEVYGTPANTFVASFVGSPPMNLFEGRTEVLDGARRFVGEIEVPLDGRWGDVPPGKAVLGIRPEKIELIPPDEADSTKGTVELVEDVGAEDIISVNIGTRSCLVRVPTHGTVRERDTVGVRLPAGSLHLFDADGQRIGPRHA